MMKERSSRIEGKEKPLEEHLGRTLLAPSHRDNFGKFVVQLTGALTT